MKLTIIGTGYVGLVTGTCFAEVGHHVICVDKDADKVKLLRTGGMPIYEPDRERSVFENARKANQGPLPDRDLQRIYERIMDVMRHIQQEEIAPETIAPHDGLGETEIDTEVND